MVTIQSLLVFLYKSKAKPKLFKNRASNPISVWVEASHFKVGIGHNIGRHSDLPGPKRIVAAVSHSVAR